MRYLVITVVLLATVLSVWACGEDKTDDTTVDTTVAGTTAAGTTADETTADEETTAAPEA